MIDKSRLSKIIIIAFVSFVGLCLVILFSLSAYYRIVEDDTFITFRYAQHWVESGLLTWHKDLPPVDGFTSLSHVLILTSFHKMGFDLLKINSALNIVCVLLIVLFYLLSCRHLKIPFLYAATGLFLLVINTDLQYWLTGGLDTILYSMTIIACYYYYEKVLTRHNMSFAFFVTAILLILTRPEGSIIMFGLIIYVFADYINCGVIITLKNYVYSGIIIICILSLHAWRFFTYGYIFPNAYYAKSSANVWLEMETGLLYVGIWLLFYGGALFVVTLLNIKKQFFLNTRLYFILGLIAIAIVSGGDTQTHMRFMVPLISLLCLHVADLLSTSRLVIKCISILLIILYSTLQFSGQAVNRIHPLNVGSVTLDKLLFPLDFTQRFVDGAEAIISRKWPLTSARYVHWSSDESIDLGKFLRKGITVAATDVGALAYYSRLKIIDTHGLNSKEIAHLRKPEGTHVTWGVFRLDAILKKQLVDVIIIGHPMYLPAVKATDDIDLAKRPFDRQRIYFGRTFNLDIEQMKHYTCVTIKQDGKEKYMSFLVRKDKINKIWKKKPRVFYIANCL